MNNHIDKIINAASNIIEGEYDFTDLCNYFTLNVDKNFYDPKNAFFYDIYIHRCICNYVVYANLTYTQKESTRIMNIGTPDDEYDEYSN